MAGTFAPKVLGEGQLASTKGTLYTAPASTSAYIRSFNIYSTSATLQTVNVYLKPGATSRQVVRFQLSQYESVDVISLVGPFVLETGDLIEGDTTTATAVDYIITGIEET